MIKKGIVTLALITLLLAPMHVEAHNAVKVSGQSVAVTMGNGQTLREGKWGR